VLPCPLAQQKLKALKMPREGSSGYIDWMRWAGLGCCTEELEVEFRRRLRCCDCNNLARKKRQREKKIKTHKKHISHGGTVEPRGLERWFWVLRMLNSTDNLFLDSGVNGLIK